MRISLATLFLILAAIPASAQVSLAWVQRYSGPLGDSDSVLDLALDDQGNVFVTGVSGYTVADIATAKYSPSGQLLWVRTYDGPAHQSDGATRIAVRDGSVYVAGHSSDDYVLIKYDSAGTQQWVARRVNAGQDRIVGLAVDSAGLVYVTGYTQTGSWTDITTIKYNGQGQVVWARSFDGPAHQFDEPNELRVNTAGDVYVCGKTHHNGDWDAVLLKYNAAGTLQWSRTLTTSAADVETFEALELDADGDIVVVGSSGTFWVADLVALKYSPQGDVRWSRRYHGPTAGAGADSAFGLAVDGARNIYIAGQTFGPAYNLATTIAYDPSGEVRWIDRHDPGFPAAADCVVLDAAGAVYTSVRFDPAGGDPLNARVIKYSGGPNVSWAYTYSGPLNYLDIINRIAVAQDGGLVAGGVADFGPLGEVGDFLTFKLSQAQACYSNCDGSVTAPLLSANDFQCFLNKFATKDAYANCDGSVVQPTLTANDFQCFINAFAAGCP